jgi:predicted nucleic acid-binding protein
VIAYLDSSVVLRVVLGQRGRLKEWMDIEEGVASAMVGVECFRTLDRLRLSRRLDDERLVARREAVYRMMGEISVVEPGRAVLDRASMPLPAPLGTLDAIHLATALLWRERESAEIVMATHDGALAAAARASGLPVVGV